MMLSNEDIAKEVAYRQEEFLERILGELLELSVSSCEVRTYYQIDLYKPCRIAILLPEHLVSNDTVDKLKKALTTFVEVMPLRYMTEEELNSELPISFKTIVHGTFCPKGCSYNVLVCTFKILTKDLL